VGDDVKRSFRTFIRPGKFREMANATAIADQLHPDPIGRNLDRENKLIFCTRVFHMRFISFRHVPEW
jgi:hypothetical protein